LAIFTLKHKKKAACDPKTHTESRVFDRKNLNRMPLMTSTSCSIFSASSVVFTLDKNQPMTEMEICFSEFSQLGGKFIKQGKVYSYL